MTLPYNNGDNYNKETLPNRKLSLVLLSIAMVDLEVIFNFKVAGNSALNPLFFITSHHIFTKEVFVLVAAFFIEEFSQPKRRRTYLSLL